MATTEEWRRVSFSWFGKNDLLDESGVLYDVWLVSSLGRIKHKNRIVSSFLHGNSKNQKRLVFKYYGKAVAVASVVCCAFIDPCREKYTFNFKNGNSSDCSLSNLEIVYRPKYRPVSQKVLDEFDVYITSMDCRRLFFSFVSRKTFYHTAFFSYDDLFQDFMMYLFENLANYEHDTFYRDIKHFAVFSAPVFYKSYIRTKINTEKLRKISVDAFSRDGRYSRLLEII
jgi:hypothetical protein